MRFFAFALVFSCTALVPDVARATDISPTVKASIHDEPPDGLGDTFNVPPFEGLLRKQSTREDRAIQEFSVAGFTSTTIQSATLSGIVYVNNAADNGVRTFDFLLYAGNGTADLTDFQIAGTLVGSGSYHPPITSSFSYSFDVTAVAQSLLSGGASWIGLQVVCTSSPNFPNILDDAMSRLSIVLPSVVGTPFCRGDGSGTPCPCGNNSPLGTDAGCQSSLAIGGVLSASGTSVLTNDTVVLQGSSMPNSSALYFQGTAQQSAGAGALFGDGLRCAAGTIVRLATATNVGGTSQYPFGALPAVSVKGNVTAPGLRHYQIWYRNAAAFCTPLTFNLTNGWTLMWTP